MILYQKVLCKLINLFFPVLNKIDKKFKEIGLVFFWLLIIFSGMFYMSIPISIHLLYKCMIGAVLLGGVIFCSLDREIKPVKWDPKAAVLWFILGILQLISGVAVSIEFLPLACIWLVEFPALFLVWSNRRDYIVLFEAMMKSINVAAIVYILLSVCLIPITESQYCGFMLNPNGLGQFLTLTFPFAIMLAFQGKSKLGRNIAKTEALLTVSLLFFSRGRTALLAVGAMILMLVVSYSYYNRHNIRKILKKIVYYSIGTILCTVIVFVVNQAVSNTLHVGDLYINMQLSGKHEKLTSSEEAAEKFVEKITGQDKQSDSVEDYSSGRTGIWQETIRRLNWIGHPSREHIVTVRNGDVGNNTHNTFLQFAYDNGILTGILFFFMVAYAGIKLLYRYWNEKEFYNIKLIMLLTQIGFCVTSVFTSLNLPFLYMITLSYYITYVEIVKIPKGENCEKNISNIY